MRDKIMFAGDERPSHQTLPRVRVRHFLWHGDLGESDGVRSSQSGREEDWPQSSFSQGVHAKGLFIELTRWDRKYVPMEIFE